jgi:two-component system response regulator (stage 0 sporulation protein F)
MNQVSRVLVVDDDRGIRLLLSEILTDEGYEVLEAADGAEGVTMVKVASPDLVIMDLRMPVMTGVEAIRQLKEDPTTSQVPILAMSAGTVLRQEAAQLPVSGLIDKPFDIDALIARVALHLNQESSGATSPEPV